MTAAAAVAVVGVVALMAMAFAGGAQRSVRLPAKTLTIETVTQGVFRDFTPLQGKVVPRDTVYLDALEGGQVEKVLVQAGDRVALGQPLIAFRNTQLELEVLDREGRLIESITQLQAYEKQLEQNRAANETTLARIDYDILRLSRLAERRDVLAAKGYLPQQARDETHDELNHNQRLRPLQMETNRRQEELRLKQLPQIRAELEGLQQSLKITRSKMDALVVKAPVAGRLTAIDLKIGQNRNRGERLAEITPDTGFRVQADVDEYYLGRVRTGQTGEVDWGGATRRLRVSRIYPQVKNGTFVVDLDFDGAQPAALTPGEAMQGRLSLGGDRPALILPAGAFLERSGGDWVFVVDGNKALKRRIKVGRRSTEQVEVLAGLRPGDRVITSDYAGLEKIDRVDLAN
jgi:HlyD family secretion protein